LWDQDKNNPELLSVADTVGFVKIVLGSTKGDKGEIDEGIALIKEVKERALQQDNNRIKRTAEAFCRRHLHLGEKKIGRVG
jgi:hypothetical protein